jgi:hypothetical protein
VRVSRGTNGVAGPQGLNDVDSTEPLPDGHPIGSRLFIPPLKQNFDVGIQHARTL